MPIKKSGGAYFKNTDMLNHDSMKKFIDHIKPFGITMRAYSIYELEIWDDPLYNLIAVELCDFITENRVWATDEGDPGFNLLKEHTDPSLLGERMLLWNLLH